MKTGKCEGVGKNGALFQKAGCPPACNQAVHLVSAAEGPGLPRPQCILIHW